MTQLRLALICSTLLAPLASPLPAADAPPPAANAAHSCYWVFLNKGNGREKLTGMTKEAVAKMQADHVGNLGALYKQGRAFTAGPLGDNGFIRGIVILNVRTPEEVKDCFKPDPFDQNDILAVEAYRWLTDTAKFHKAVEPFQLAKHTLGIVKKGKSFKPSTTPPAHDAMLSLLPGLRPMAGSGELAVSGPLLDAGDNLGILLFTSPDAAKLQSILDQDSVVKRGEVVVELHPQLMGAGVLKLPEATKSEAKPKAD
jgi:uncharacterized protein YciI